ncbi:MAG TPA: hypothetical protein ENJ87_10200 [Gammaproteobacteria bacterium]|nr:hypothetical protein [Gammaproteobacteria bacterium]
MSNRLIRTGLPVICLMTLSFSADADWSKTPKGYYNHGYGDFPPSDIDQQLFGHLETGDTSEKSKTPDTETSNSPSSPLPAPVPAHNNPGQSRQNAWQPAYGNYDQRRNYARPNDGRYDRGTRFDGPWNNNQSGFNGPWNNRSTNFSGPWNNNRSGFSGPWSNNGSGFSMPWGNNGSGFSPMGNGNRWGW